MLIITIIWRGLVNQGPLQIVQCPCNTLSVNILISFLYFYQYAQKCIHFSDINLFRGMMWVEKELEGYISNTLCIWPLWKTEILQWIASPGLFLFWDFSFSLVSVQAILFITDIVCLCFSKLRKPLLRIFLTKSFVVICVRLLLHQFVAVCSIH